MPDVERIRRKYEALASVMDERVTRLWLAAEAEAIGRGGETSLTQRCSRGWIERAASIATCPHAEIEPDVTLIDTALTELAYRPGAHAGEVERPGLSAALIGTIDRAELVAITTAIGELLFRRTHRGSGGLLTWYRRTIAAWQAAHPGSALGLLAAEFLASPAAANWRESADDRIGISLEEAFFRFAEASGVADPATREQELLAAIVRGLVVCPEPAFVVPSRVRRCPGGWVAVARVEVDVLYAALKTRFVMGPITALLADLLEGVDPIAPADVVSGARGELTAMGLIS